MKKFFSTLLVLFATLIAGVSFVSCSGDDDDDESGIVGTWHPTAEFLKKIIGAAEIEKSGFHEEDGPYFMFCADGTAYRFELWDECTYLDDIDKYTYNFDEETGRLTMQGESGFADVKIKGNNMTWTAGGVEIQMKRVTSPWSRAKLDEYWEKENK